jgi:hypothetical protein
VARQARRDPQDLARRRPRHTVFAYTPVDFEQAYGRDYQKPGKMARFLAFVYRLVPKVGR